MSAPSLSIYTRLNAKEALRRGYSVQPDQRGFVCVAIPADIPADDRVLIASALHDRPDNTYTIATPTISPAINEPTVAGILEAIRDGLAKELAEKAKRDVERAAEEAKRTAEIAAVIANRTTTSESARVYAGNLRAEYAIVKPATYLGNPPPPEAAEWLEVLAEKNAAAKAAAEAELAVLVADAEAAKVAAEAEEVAWIGRHGSPRLRRLLLENIEYRGVYFSERLALDRPNWRVWNDIPGEESEPRNAPEEALDLLDEARKVEPKGHLVYITVDWKDDAEAEAAGSESRYKWTGYGVLAEFLGRTIVLGGPPAPATAPRPLVELHFDVVAAVDALLRAGFSGNAQSDSWWNDLHEMVQRDSQAAAIRAARKGGAA